MNEHRLRKLRAIDRDFGQDDGKPMVTKIKVTDATPDK